jgi:peptidyl-prolyl cis-trans isomerase B (cyclophilin B)
MVIVAVLLVGGAGTAYALTRDRSDHRTLATPTATPTPDASSPGSGAEDGFDPGAGTPSASPRKASPSQAGSPAVTAECRYVPTSAGDGGGQGSLSMPNPRPQLTARTHAVLTTNYGVIEADLAGGAAPCTVNSFLTLARGGFFTGTQCHRLTTASLYVLQCGDPSATGQGGPGYQFDDENLPTKSKPAYPRGTLAMANSGPGTNGSQFFLVYKDSAIDPNYSVFGRITAGLDVLDRIAAAGTDESNGPGDGHPKLEVTISRVG